MKAYIEIELSSDFINDDRGIVEGSALGLVRHAIEMQMQSIVRHLQSQPDYNEIRESNNLKALLDAYASLSAITGGHCDAGTTTVIPHYDLKKKALKFFEDAFNEVK